MSGVLEKKQNGNREKLYLDLKPNICKIVCASGFGPTCIEKYFETISSIAIKTGLMDQECVGIVSGTEILKKYFPVTFPLGTMY